MRSGLPAWVVLATFLSATASVADDVESCRFGKDAEVQIPACDRVIASGAHRGEDLATLYYARGFLYFMKRDADRAAADFSEAIKLDSTNAQAFSYRAAALSETHPTQALADLGEAIRLEPDSPFSYYARGDLHGHLKDYAQAIADYNEALRLDPDFSKGYRNRGRFFAALKDHDRAIADFSEAIRLSHDYPSAFLSRGESYAAKGDYDRAIADYEQALKLDPKFSAAVTARDAAVAARAGKKQDMTASPSDAAGTRGPPGQN